MHTITITHAVEPSFLWDIMTTAVESGYEWFAFRCVKRKPEDHEHMLAVTSFDAIEVDCDGGDGKMSRKTIGEADIVNAIQKMLVGGKVHDSHMSTLRDAVAQNDASNIDADLADCIVQVACFDEIRYG